MPVATLFLGLWALFCCSFFCPLGQPCKTLQIGQLAQDKLVRQAFLIQGNGIIE